ncbi:type II secretory pathway protein [Aliidiomarina sp. Khilg15.8]
MFPKSSLRRQRGSSLIVAIFIIVVMSILAAVIARVLSASSRATVDEVYGSRALAAANSGAQIFMTDLFPLGSKGASNAACNTGRNQTFNVEGLQSCSATVNCEERDYSNDHQLTHFRITATGQCSAAGKTYSRQIIVEAVDGNF